MAGDLLKDVADLRWRGYPERDVARRGTRRRHARRGLVDDLKEYADARVVPAGTGTTALFLVRHLRDADVEVCAAPCATDVRGEAPDDIVGRRLRFHSAFPLAKAPPYRDGAPIARLAAWRELAASGLSSIGACASGCGAIANDGRPAPVRRAARRRAGVATQLNERRTRVGDVEEVE